MKIILFTCLIIQSALANLPKDNSKKEPSDALGSNEVIDYWVGTKLNSSDAVSDDVFGNAVSISGEKALIGAAEKNAVGFNSGAVYSFELESNQWIEKQQLLASDLTGGVRFGHSVALDGNWSVVTAPSSQGKFINTGAAYVFQYQGNSWVETQKLTASQAGDDDYLGITSAISGDWIMVGAWGGQYGVGIGIYNIGEVYVYHFDGVMWNETQKLIASDFRQGDLFGEAIAIDGTRALIGSRSLENNRIGAAYVFELNEGIWTESQKLITSNGSGNQYFGRSLDISGDMMLVGAYEDHAGGFDLGSVYVFEYDGLVWNESQILNASDASDYDRFGRSISMSQGRALIGAFNDQEMDYYGSAYLFEQNGGIWIESKKVTAVDGVGDSNFGYSVSLSGDIGLVGALFDDSQGNNSGSAFVFMSELIFKNGLESIK